MLIEKTRRDSRFPKLHRMKSMRTDYSGITVTKQAINKESEELINDFKNNSTNP